jgi:cytosine/uracil/thiamine/allantoin permease
MVLCIAQICFMIFFSFSFLIFRFASKKKKRFFFGKLLAFIMKLVLKGIVIYLHREITTIGMMRTKQKNRYSIRIIILFLEPILQTKPTISWL